MFRNKNFVENYNVTNHTNLDRSKVLLVLVVGHVRVAICYRIYHITISLHFLSFLSMLYTAIHDKGNWESNCQGINFISLTIWCGRSKMTNLLISCSHPLTAKVVRPNGSWPCSCVRKPALILKCPTCNTSAGTSLYQTHPPCYVKYIVMLL